MKAEDIKCVASIGGGVIGSSWTLLFAMRGLKVFQYDINDAQIEGCKKNIENNINSLIEFGAIKAEDKEEIKSKSYLIHNKNCRSGKRRSVYTGKRSGTSAYQAGYSG